MAFLPSIGQPMRWQAMILYACLCRSSAWRGPDIQHAVWAGLLNAREDAWANKGKMNLGTKSRSRFYRLDYLVLFSHELERFSPWIQRCECFKLENLREVFVSYCWQYVPTNATACSNIIYKLRFSRTNVLICRGWNGGGHQPEHSSGSWGLCPSPQGCGRIQCLISGC